MSFSRAISSGPGLMILPDGSVSTAKLANFAVDADKIADGAIIADKLAVESVRTAAIDDGAVTNPKIADDAVRESAIQADAVTADKIGAGAVTASKIAVDAVTTTKILDDAVTNDKIADGHIESYHFAAEAVNTAAIGDGAVTNAKVTSITYAKISDPPTIPALSDSAPAALGVASAGVAATSARSDHVHAVPALAENTEYQGFVPIFDEDLDTKWVPGVGFEPNWKSPTAGPFDLTDGDAMNIRVSYAGGTTVDTQTFTVNIADVGSIDAVTVDELVAIIYADCPRLRAYKDPDTDQLVISMVENSSPSWTPDSYMIATSVSATLATALGVNAYDYAFGSGGTPAMVTSANSAPFTFAGETLSVVVNGAAIATDAFLAADDTAVEVASRINGTVALAGKVYAFPVGNTVRIIRESASEKDYLQISSGGANAVLAFPTTSQVGVGNALAESLRQAEQLSRIVKEIITDSHEIASLVTTSGAIAIDMAGGAVQNLTINGTSSFTVTNIDSMGFSYTIQIFITGSGTRTVSFDTDWKWIGSKPTSIADGVTGCLTLTNRGSSDTDIVASYAVLGAG